MDQDVIRRTVSADAIPTRRLRFWFAAVLCAVLTSTAFAATPTALVRHARIRLLPGDLPLAGYFDLANTGRRPLVLIGASSDAFRMVMMHHTVHRNGQDQMLPVHNLEIKPGQTLHFTPGVYHLMLMHRKRQLAVGDHVPIRLKFSDGDSLEVTFTVNGADTE